LRNVDLVAQISPARPCRAAVESRGIVKDRRRRWVNEIVGRRWWREELIDQLRESLDGDLGEQWEEEVQ
jgi:hypothetical protein